jgi:hypothetical protein
MEVKLDDLSGPAIAMLLHEHLHDMAATWPPDKDARLKHRRVSLETGSMEAFEPARKRVHD